MMIDRGHINLTVADTILKEIKFPAAILNHLQTLVTQKYYHYHNAALNYIETAPAWLVDLLETITRQHQHYEIALMRLDPGNTVPIHHDLHTSMIKKHGDVDTWRYKIFLQDWKPGHYFEIQNQPVVGWYAGDWIKFHRSQAHLAGNMGTEPLYAANITVT